MSEEGYNKLLADLKQLETIERPKIVAAIAEARDKGDLSENAEYDAAKEAQGLLEMKINKLKQVIADAKILRYAPGSGSPVPYQALLFLQPFFLSSTESGYF